MYHQLHDLNYTWLIVENFSKILKETVLVTSGLINMITLQNIELPLDGRLCLAFNPISAPKSSDAAALVRMSVYTQAPYYYYYY